MTDTVEAAIVFENGRLCFAAANTKQRGLKTGKAIDAIIAAVREGMAE